MKKELQLKARRLRIKGYSVKELHKLLNVSKASISLWVRDVKLSKKAKARIEKNYTKGQLASQKTIREKTARKILEAEKFAKDFLNNVDIPKNMILLLCSMLYQCEGSKNIKDLITFTNSEPDLIKTFLILLRKSFVLNESKFRVVMHLHNYHNENTQKKLWSAITNIPKQQFLKTFQKHNTGIYKKEGYPGCIQIRYRDVIIGRKLQAVAKMFMERYK